MFTQTSSFLAYVFYSTVSVTCCCWSCILLLSPRWAVSRSFICSLLHAAHCVLHLLSTLRQYQKKAIQSRTNTRVSVKSNESGSFCRIRTSWRVHCVPMESTVREQICKVRMPVAKFISFRYSIVLRRWVVFFQGFKGISSTMTIKYAGVHSRRLVRRLLQTRDYSFERKNPIHGNYSVYRFNRTSFYHHLTRCLPKSPWHSYNFHPKQLGASLARHSPMKHKSDSILLWLLTTSLGISCMATNQSFADRDSQRSALG